jgi:hypothetical protein
MVILLTLVSSIMRKDHLSMHVAQDLLELKKKKKNKEEEEEEEEEEARHV